MGFKRLTTWVNNLFTASSPTHACKKKTTDAKELLQKGAGSGRQISQHAFSTYTVEFGLLFLAQNAHVTNKSQPTKRRAPFCVRSCSEVTSFGMHTDQQRMSSASRAEPVDKPPLVNNACLPHCRFVAH